LSRASSFVAAEHLLLGDGQVVGDAHVGKQLEVLEDHPDPAAQLGQIGLRVAHRNAIHVMVPDWKGSRPLTHLMRVDLPLPEGPQTTTTSPFFTWVVQSVRTWKLP
jgi:hypothetical protein